MVSWRSNLHYDIMHRSVIKMRAQRPQAYAHIHRCTFIVMFMICRCHSVTVFWKEDYRGSDIIGVICFVKHPVVSLSHFLCHELHAISATSSSLKITNRSFRYASPHLWNQLPVSFRQPCTKHPADDVILSNSPSTYSPLSPSITHSLFHSRLKTHLFHKSFPPYLASTNLDCLLGLYWTGLTLWGFPFLV